MYCISIAIWLKFKALHIVLPHLGYLAASPIDSGDLKIASYSTSDRKGEKQVVHHSRAHSLSSDILLAW